MISVVIFITGWASAMGCMLYALWLNLNKRQQEKEAKDPLLAKLRSRKQTGAIFGFVMSIGFVFLSMGVIFYFENLEHQRTWIPVSAVITNREKKMTDDGPSYSFYISYEYQGHTYNHIRLNKSNSSMRVGNALSVRVDPTDPKTAELVTKHPILPLLFSVLGLIPFLLGLFCVRSAIRDIARLKKAQADTGDTTTHTAVSAEKGAASKRLPARTKPLWKRLVKAAVSLSIFIIFVYEICRYWSVNPPISYALIVLGAFILYRPLLSFFRKH